MSISTCHNKRLYSERTEPTATWELSQASRWELIDRLCPRFSSCSFSCRQTPVPLAAIRFPGRSLTGQAALRPPLPPPPLPPPSTARPTKTGSWRAAARSWTQRWGCTALRTPQRPPPAKITPTTSPTAPTHPLSTPLWWVSSMREKKGKGEKREEGGDQVDQSSRVYQFVSYWNHMCPDKPFYLAVIIIMFRLKWYQPM